MTVQLSVEPKKKIKPSATRQETSIAKRGVVVTRAVDIKPQKLARVWSGRFFRGKLGFIAGEPGLGKSQIAIHMAATISHGGKWPRDEGKARRGDVIYISAEDRAADTIRPRLEAAGADLKRVHIIEAVNDALGTRPFSLLTDLGRKAPCSYRLRHPFHQGQGGKHLGASDRLIRFCRGRAVRVYGRAQAGRPEPAGFCGCEE
jgi:hypothetical protein